MTNVENKIKNGPKFFYFLLLINYLFYQIYFVKNITLVLKDVFRNSF